MSSWLRFLLGIDGGEIPPGGVVHFELGSMPGGWRAAAALLLAVLATGLVVLIYRRESELHLWKRLTLTSLRLLALALLLLVLLNPRILVEVQVMRKAETLLLVDGSGSMYFRDRYEGRDDAKLRWSTGLDRADGSRREGFSRSELTAAALEKSQLAAKLGENNKVRSFLFHERIVPADPSELPDRVRSIPGSGKSTWLGSSIREALAAARANPIAAVVVISDGKSNGGDSLEGVATELFARGIPLHALGVGKSDLPRNIAITELRVPEVAEVGLPVRISVRVHAVGLPGEIELGLHRARMGDKSYEHLQTEQISIQGMDLEVMLNFSDMLIREGSYRYFVDIQPIDGEESDRDNEKFADVTVVNQKRRILLLGGSPSFLFRFLRDFFLRDPGIQLSTWLQCADLNYPQDGNVPISRPPATDEDLRPFDAVVLIDPDPSSLRPEFIPALKRFVSDMGGGLAYVAGEHYTRTMSGSPRGRELLSLLPILLEEGHPGNDLGTAWRASLTAAGKTHAICQLRARVDENIRLWSILPPFYFRFPVLRLKAAATSLLRAGEEHVAAIHQAGAGRVLFLATDDLYRWREYRQGIHEQFWSGATRYLALGKQLAGTRQFSINTDRERYLLGDEVRIEAHILDSGFQPVVEPRVSVVIEPAVGWEENSDSSPASLDRGSSSHDGGERLLWLEAIPHRLGWFGGRWKSDALGHFRVQLDESGTGGIPVGFRVSKPTGEADDRRPDLVALGNLARGSGGTFGLLEEINAIPGRIPDRTVVDVLGRKTRTVWDSAFLLMVFALALVLEWILRKKWRLS